MRFFATDNTRRTFEVQDRYTSVRSGYVLADDEHLVATWNGWHTIVRPTGRTRKFWGIDCPTFVRHDVETIADENGVIWGIVGERTPGTVAIRPEQLRDLEAA